MFDAVCGFLKLTVGYSGGNTQMKLTHESVRTGTPTPTQSAQSSTLSRSPTTPSSPTLAHVSARQRQWAWRLRRRHNTILRTTIRSATTRSTTRRISTQQPGTTVMQDWSAVWHHDQEQERCFASAPQPRRPGRPRRAHGGVTRRGEAPPEDLPLPTVEGRSCLSGFEAAQRWLRPAGAVGRVDHRGQKNA
ncbi:unnamed protein product [Prorocentrum cordatum]|uniref:Uncharacterized protein n=1 Tax=Prorocentrum cordatum TaxID=2364126 RepID=A0ABN9RUY5_9DINO|nr:unnamed protein product [Polarella glacialis]